jgi:hypothetical protein
MNKLWDKAKKQGQKTKLRGQIHLSQREITGRKKKFGVELYDMLTNDKEKLLGVSAGTLFKDKSTEELKEPFERAKEEISAMQARKDVKQRELDAIEIDSHHSISDESIGEKAKRAGKAIADASVQAKIKAQMVLIDREMKIRKEKFGVEVFDIAIQSDQHKKKDEGGPIMDSISEQEKDILDVIDSAKNDVLAMEEKQKALQREIGMIDEEMQPLSQQQHYDDNDHDQDEEDL